MGAAFARLEFTFGGGEDEPAQEEEAHPASAIGIDPVAQTHVGDGPALPGYDAEDEGSDARYLRSRRRDSEPHSRR